MKVRRLTVDVLYDEADESSVEVLLDKMTTDWLLSGPVAEYKESLGESSDPDPEDWEWFWEYDSDADIWRQRT